MTRRLMHMAVLVSLVVGLLVGSSPATGAAASTANGFVSAAEGALTTEQVVGAFRRAGLEVGASRPLMREEYGEAPLPIEGTGFAIPSFRQDIPGRVLRYGTQAEARSAREHYGMLAKESGAARSHIFVRDTILVLLTGDLPQEEASAFEKALNAVDLTADNQEASALASSPTDSATPVAGPSGITFGKPYVVHGHHASNPFWNLLYLLGVWTAPPSGDFVEKVAVLATNTTDQVKSFEVRATFGFGESAVSSRAHPVYELLPGRSRPLTIAVDPDVPVTYDSVGVEIARMVRESPTTPGAEAARRIVFGTPSTTSAFGSPEKASVEITNQGPKRQGGTVWLALLRGDELLGVASCYGEIAAGQTQTASLWTMLGTVSGYDRAYLDLEIDQGNEGRSAPYGIDCGGASPSAAATGWAAAGDSAGVEPINSPTTAQVVEAFGQAGLEVGSPRPMTRDELDADSKLGESSFGLKVPAAREGTRFSIPAFGEKVGGQVLFFDATEHADMAAQYYTARSELADRPEDRARVYARGHLVLLLDRGVPETAALAYEKALQASVAAFTTSSGDASGTGESKGK